MLPRPDDPDLWKSASVIDLGGRTLELDSGAEGNELILDVRRVGVAVGWEELNQVEESLLVIGVFVSLQGLLEDEHHSMALSAVLEDGLLDSGQLLEDMAAEKLEGEEVFSEVSSIFDFKGLGSGRDLELVADLVKDDHDGTDLFLSQLGDVALLFSHLCSVSSHVGENSLLLDDC